MFFIEWDKFYSFFVLFLFLRFKKWKFFKFNMCEMKTFSLALVRLNKILEFFVVDSNLKYENKELKISL